MCAVHKGAEHATTCMHNSLGWNQDEGTQYDATSSASPQAGVLIIELLA